MKLKEKEVFSEKKGRVLGRFFAFLLLYAVSFLALILVLTFVVVAFSVSTDSNVVDVLEKETTAYAAIVYTVTAVVFGIVYICFNKKQKDNYSRFKQPFYSILLGASVQFLVGSIVYNMPWPEQWVETIHNMNLGMMNQSLLINILVYDLLSSVSIIIMYSVFYVNFRRAFSIPFSVGAIVIIFCFINIITGDASVLIQVTYGLPIFVMAFMLRERYDSLLPSLLAHVSFKIVGRIPYYEKLPSYMYIILLTASVAIAIYTIYQIWFNKKDSQTERNIPDET
jgi:hypothetical protein